MVVQEVLRRGGGTSLLNNYTTIGGGGFHPPEIFPPKKLPRSFEPGRQVSGRIENDGRFLRVRRKNSRMAMSERKPPRKRESLSSDTGKKRARDLPKGKRRTIPDSGLNPKGSLGTNIGSEKMSLAPKGRPHWQSPTSEKKKFGTGSSYSTKDKFEISQGQSGFGGASSKKKLIFNSSKKLRRKRAPSSASTSKTKLRSAKKILLGGSHVRVDQNIVTIRQEKKGEASKGGGFPCSCLKGAG